FEAAQGPAERVEQRGQQHAGAPLPVQAGEPALHLAQQPPDAPGPPPHPPASRRRIRPAPAMPPRICTRAKPPTPTISAASRAAIAMVTVLDGSRIRSATARPAARKAAWPMTTAVLV